MKMRIITNNEDDSDVLPQTHIHILLGENLYSRKLF